MIVVDGREKAREECGDLLPAVLHGVFAWDQLIELGELVAGCAAGRTAAAQITLFESHGLGIQDLYVAIKAVQLARARGIGLTLPVTALANDDRRFNA